MNNYPKKEVDLKSLKLFDNFVQRCTYSQRKLKLKLKIKSLLKSILGISQ
jgi:hypothetical protein